MESKQILEFKRIFIDRFELISSLGKGWSSEVFLAKDLSHNGKLIALKIFNK